MPGEDRFAQAQELLDAGTPQSWVWKEDGLRVVGEVMNAFTMDTRFQENCPVLTLKLQDGTLRSVWGTGVLEDKFRQLEREGLAIGDIVGVERGEEQAVSKSGSEYWPFKVVRIPGPNAQRQGMFGAATPVEALPAGAQAVVEEMDAEVVYQRPPREEVRQEQRAPAPAPVRSGPAPEPWSDAEMEEGGF